MSVFGKSARSTIRVRNFYNISNEGKLFNARTVSQHLSKFICKVSRIVFRTKKNTTVKR